jgi:predicted CoA-substrate-specific enzyme activase
MTRRRLGIDMGSVAIHAALLDERDQVLWSDSETAAGRPMQALETLLAGIPTAAAEGPMAVVVTGSGRELAAAALTGCQRVNGVVSTARGAAAVSPGARGVIEIGGHMSRWIALEEGAGGDIGDFSLSDLCAAGAGVFLEQQSGRLELDVAELAERARVAPRGATVAGRCAVFAKSDMIHLQQKGTPVEEIAYGLCLALARSFQASVLRGRELLLPALLVGGGAANAGLDRALREVLHLDEDALSVPERHAEIGAIGAALLASEDAGLDLERARALLADATHLGATLPTFDPLPDPGVEPPRPEPRGEQATDEPLLLGVDVGSVSTDLVLMTCDGELVDAVYSHTRGEPLTVLQEGLTELSGRCDGELNICGVGTTGSGRHLAGRFLGADRVRNEITAQLRAAAEFMPRIDTVLEIGGQDSKYISARDGHIVDFTMNKVCAAGTGSFLEEQATRLDISIIDEFAELALRAEAPVDLGSRCTVFMDTELAHALQAGAGTEDLTAGLAIAVARNYLDKVVAGRPIGEHVLFQGGTASNRAVVAAFRQILGKPVQVHPYNRLSGAIGAALLVRDAQQAGDLPSATGFRGVDACRGELEKSFECKRCVNRCQVNRFRSGSQVFFFGDTCERFSARGGQRKKGANREHALALRQRWLLEESGIVLGDGTDYHDDARVLGIPRVAVGLQLLPVWTAIARAAGRQPVLSQPSSPDALAAAQRHLRADTCLPVKLAYGHVEDLLSRGVEDILLPSVASLPSGQPGESSSVTCPFTQHLASMVRGQGWPELLTPELALHAAPGEQIVDPAALAERLEIPVTTLERAIETGLERVQHWQERLRLLGEAILERAGDRVLVLLGRSYTLADPFLNMDLGRHLERLGLPFLSLDALPIHEVALDETWNPLVWSSNRDYIRAAMLVRRDPRLFPVVLSSFGCGPDGFTLKHMEELLVDRPRLFLELDEHRGEAGFVTRLEAFSDEIDAHLREKKAAPAADRPLSEIVAPARPARETGRLVVPYFSDHAYAFVGALGRGDREVVLMPPPATESRLLGESLTSGRECHPFALLAGDLAHAVQTGLLRKGDSYFFPGGINACLFSQYPDGLRHALRRIGGDGIEIVTPDLDGMRDEMGYLTGVHLWEGVVTIDMLIRMCCEKRPYELNRGEVDAIHLLNLEELAAAVQVGEVLDFLPTAVNRMERIEQRQGPRRPRIGVAGDVYTRINPFASGDLFTRLENLGCEVWPAPFLVDNAAFNLTRRIRDAARRWDFQEFLSQGLLNTVKEFGSWRIGQTMPELADRYTEPEYDEVMELSAPYVGPGASPLVQLNLAKMVHFARNGASGILNAICFGCMVGGVSAAIVDRIRTDNGNIPMATLTFGGTEGADDNPRLEAFVHQAHRFHQRRS